MNSAIIVAAGTGSRFGGDVPKQFVKICGKPLLEHTIDKFDECPSVDDIILVVSADAVASLEWSIDVTRFAKVAQIVAGGETRAESVRKGLAALNADCKIVVVHDGARPLVTSDEIAQVIAATHKVGAACLVAGVTDTIKSVRAGEIAATLDRKNLRRALTPQAFEIGLLKRAFELGVLDEAVTDECFLVEKLGHPISIIEGSGINIKITHPEDLLFTEAILRNRSK